MEIGEHFLYGMLVNYAVYVSCICVAKDDPSSSSSGRSNQRTGWFLLYRMVPAINEIKVGLGGIKKQVGCVMLDRRIGVRRCSTVWEEVQL